VNATPARAFPIASWTWRGRLVAWRHPEWWSLAIAGGAAATLVGLHLPAADAAPALGASHHAPAARSDALLPAATIAFVQWLLMVVAMMVPLSVGAIRTTAARSLWRRRHRAIAAFLAGFLVPWAIAGLGISIAVAASMPDDARAIGAVTALAVALAAWWQRSPAKRRALMACHGTRPLAPAGWGAVRDGVGFGASIGTHCLISCWPLMLACAVSGHHPLVMVGAAALGVAERTSPRRR
jgi:predicted metal-binding membrane protein